ncbi:MAG: tetratricopeptide repeat protein [Thermodesulfovibrionales bacterium]|nr:tetratricopeptide repeat protein [Thermodesulfovibrionales bacterium]
MPKPIKKKIVKKSEPEEEIASGLKKFRERLKDKVTDLRKILIISFTLILLVAAFLLYTFYSSSRASRLFYEGYRIFFIQTGVSPQDYKKAIELLRKSYEARPDPVTLLYIIDAYYRTGAFDEALKQLQEFKNKYGDNKYLMPLCYQRMAMVYKKKGHHEEALRVYDELYKNGSTFKDLALYESARILTELKRNDEAKNRIEQLKKEFPQSPYLTVLKNI